MARQPGFAPGVFNTIWVSAAATLLLQPMSHFLSGSLWQSYRSKPESRAEWNTRVVSTIHAVASSILSGYVMWRDRHAMFHDMAYESPMAAHVIAVTSGYLAGDLILVLLSLKPWGKGDISSPLDTSIHHILGAVSFGACIYCRSSYVYSLLFIFTEASTPFVNMRWFLHEGGTKSDSVLYYVNGVMMVLSFFAVRIAMLPLQWWVVVTNLQQTVELGTVWLAGQASLGLVGGTCLNLWWFSKMIRGLKKLLRPTTSPHRKVPDGAGQSVPPQQQRAKKE